MGLATFNRVLESAIEDFGYASRIARLRGYYFQYAPELAGYLLSVPPAERLRMQGIGGGRGQKFLTAAAMAGLVTAVLAAVVSGHVLSVALIAGVLVAIAVFAALIRFQVSTWQRAAVLLDDQ
jgi:predicted lysophospholipase L1 biosynthesis ABC-type transport system permease subunit